VTTSGQTKPFQKMLSGNLRPLVPTGLTQEEVQGFGNILSERICWTVRQFEEIATL